jgi:transcriptional regulator with XRE-family HTH domain
MMADGYRIGPLQQTLADLLVTLRKAADLSQTDLARRIGYGRTHVSNAENRNRVASPEFWDACDTALNADGRLRRAYEQIADARAQRDHELAEQRRAEHRARAQAWDTGPASLVDGLSGTSTRLSAGAQESAALGGVLEPWSGEDEGVQRRTFVRLTAASLLAAGSSPMVAGSDLLVDGLIGSHRVPAGSTPDGGLADLASLAGGVQTAKRTYQAGRYAEVRRTVPHLLGALGAAAEAATVQEQQDLWDLTAQAYHVAASVQLKADDHGPAWVAADRSMMAAERSGNPLMLASSARIMTHALTASGHTTQAVALTRRAAAGLSSTWSRPTPADWSVYGSLLLRGAIAAGREIDRATALELLDEAGEAAAHIDDGHNHAWTAFGPTNVVLHRVHLSVLLGDAGTAIDCARTIDPEALPLTERRASLLIDIAQAWAQWRKYDRAYQALQAAYDIAPEELTSRRHARALVHETYQNAPPTTRNHAGNLAAQVGVNGG